MVDGYEYDIGSEGYLERARDRILENKAASLFYAALELRCFVEARQDIYLEAQKDYARSIPSRWKIGSQWKALRAVTRDHKIQHIHFTFDNGFEYDAYHIPVSESLRNMGERMGDLVHSQSEYYPPDHDWWKTTRDNIIAAYRQAWVCQRGNMLSPVLIAEDKAMGNISLTFRKHCEEDLAALRIMQMNREMTVRVDYPEKPPATWIPDV